MYQTLQAQPPMPAIFVTHGGGPMPILYPKNHVSMYKHLQQLGAFYQPKAIIIVSAHWQEKEFTILEEDRPGLLYDYGGFPTEAYKLRYDAGSTPELRNIVKQVVSSGGINLKSKSKRGYDHGVFIPLMIMYPNANIPVIQISQEANMNPERHFRLGMALTNLRKMGFMVVGSGSTYHNFHGKNPLQESIVFDQQLQRVFTTNSTLEDKLNICKNWTFLKGARDAHQRQEHLISLFTCVGSNEGRGGYKTNLDIMGLVTCNIVFE